jgi:pantoate--beta-alanine ligase
VLTVVARLFGLLTPQVAVFGQKDYQQLALIRRMVRDLAMGVEIVSGPTVREDDGLALSSRNTYLTPDQRADAVGLSRGLSVVQEAFSRGVRSRDELTGTLRKTVESHSLLRMEYGDIVHPESLEPVDPAFTGAVVAVAAHCGKTRLIDNHLLAS